MTPAGSHVVFIHGLGCTRARGRRGRNCSRRRATRRWRRAGQETRTLFEETRSHADQVAGKGINDVVDHYAQIIRGLDAPAIVIGHSFGGLIVQRLLGQDLAAAGVAIDAAPVKGVLYLPPSALRVASIALRAPANRNKAVALTPEQFHYGFANALPAQGPPTCTSGGRSPHQASRCSKPPPRTYRGGRLPRSTRATRPAGLCC